LHHNIETDALRKIDPEVAEYATHSRYGAVFERPSYLTRLRLAGWGGRIRTVAADAGDVVDRDADD
jgi:hypothetical protein